ncbi:MAG: DUF4124 domain-containing protein [Halioglobus sp.]
MKPLALLVLLALSLCVSAQVYRTTDSEGNVIFTDSPPPGSNVSDQVDIKPTNTTPPPRVIDRSEQVAPDKPAEIAPTVTITNPADGDTIPMGLGNFSVSASTSPALQPEESLVLEVSGEPWGEPQTAGYWTVTNVRRGEHTLVVLRQSSESEDIIRSEEVRLLVLRPIGVR